MSNVARVAGQAANTLTVPLNVEDVFSTYVYTGNGTSQTITNGIDLVGEGGLVWLKDRSTASTNNWLSDTEIYNNISQTYKYGLVSNSTAMAAQSSNGITTFNSDGFSLTGNAYDQGNRSGEFFASWTFRKAPKFFDCIQYTGNGSSQTINHNLGTTVGAIIIKCTDTGTNWAYWHRTFGSQEMLMLNASAATRTDLPYISDVTDSSFTVNLGSSFINENTKNHIAYVFAHNDGDGGFGPSGDKDIIKCGSYTGNGSTNGPEIDLGFEPQWLLIKKSSGSGSNWFIIDNMRSGTVSGGSLNYLYADLTSSEATYTPAFVSFNSTGFKIEYTASNLNVAGEDDIYIAIRRGPMAVPTSGTEVFTPYAPSTTQEPYWTSSFPVVDFALGRWNTGNTGNVLAFDRIRGSGIGLETNTTDSESQAANDASNYIAYIGLDRMYGFDESLGFGPSTEDMAWMWSRAPKFFDAVAYTGDGVAGRTVTHNLGVAPEMMWIKNRSTGSTAWRVYHTGLPSALYYLELSSNQQQYGLTGNFNSTAPTESVFTVGNAGQTNNSGDKYIAYLFATLDGVSKVGSYAGDGTNDGSKVIDCGFSSGARFVLIKRTDSAGSWFVFDTVRGIISGNDPYLTLDLTQAEGTTLDLLVPSSSGFAVLNTLSVVNVLGASYVFYAIA